MITVQEYKFWQISLWQTWARQTHHIRPALLKTR